MILLYIYYRNRALGTTKVTKT